MNKKKITNITILISINFILLSINGAANINLTASEILNNKLLIAINQDKYAIVKSLITSKADVNCISLAGETPLHIASRKGNIELAPLLLMHGADVQAIDKYKFTPLQVAAYYGPIENVETILDFENMARYGDPEKITTTFLNHELNNALHEAVRKDNETLMKSLISRGADKHARYSLLQGNSLLHTAATYNSLTCATYLLDYGFDPELLNDNSTRAIHIAARLNYAKFIVLLARYSTNFDVPDFVGNYPLHIAINYNSKKATAQLLANKADIECEDNLGLKPIHLAAKNNSLELVGLLICKKADVNTVSRFSGCSPLTFAINAYALDAANLLVKNGAKINSDELKYANIVFNHTDKALISHNKNYVDFYNSVVKKNKAAVYKDKIFMCVGIRAGWLSNKVDLKLLKGLMPLCTMALKSDISESNIFHLIFVSYPENINIDVIALVLSVNPDLVYMPNKAGQTPIDLVIKSKNFYILSILFKAAFGDSYNPLKLVNAANSSSSSSTIYRNGQTLKRLRA